MLPFATHPQSAALRDAQTAENCPAKSTVFPHCQIDQGVCAALMASLPFAIVGLQFLRDEVDAVQDGIIVFSNARADALFATPGKATLKGAMFLSAFGDALPFGLWQRLLWVAACGRPETIHLPPDARTRRSEILVAAPYRDGLIMSKSITESASF